MDHESMNLWDDEAVVQAYCTTTIKLADKIGKWYASHREHGGVVCELLGSLKTLLDAFGALCKRYDAIKKKLDNAQRQRRPSVEDASAHPSKGVAA